MKRQWKRIGPMSVLDLLLIGAALAGIALTIYAVIKMTESEP